MSEVGLMDYHFKTHTEKDKYVSVLMESGTPSNTIIEKLFDQQIPPLSHSAKSTPFNFFWINPDTGSQMSEEASETEIKRYP